MFLSNRIMILFERSPHAAPSAWECVVCNCTKLQKVILHLFGCLGCHARERNILVLPVRHVCSIKHPLRTLIRIFIWYILGVDHLLYATLNDGLGTLVARKSDGINLAPLHLQIGVQYSIELSMAF